MGTMGERKISLKFKISFTLFWILTSLLLIAGTCTTVQYNQKITTRSNQHIEENLRIMSERIGTIFQNGNLCANYLVLNINRILKEEGHDTIATENMIRAEINQEVLIFEGVHSIVYITASGKMYSTDVKLLERKEQILHSEYLKQLERGTGRTRLFDLVSDCMEYEGARSIVTMGKRVNNVTTGKLEGYMLLNIESDYVSSSVENNITSYFMFDSLGKRMGDTTKASWVTLKDMDNEKQVVKKNKKRYVIATKEVEGYRWTLLGVTDLDKFRLSQKEIGLILLQNGLIILAILFIVGGAVTRMITSPLEQLTEGALKLADGNMDVNFQIHTRDEIGTLAAVFQHMSTQINELIERVNVEASKKREYELALIQEQVKPHFLYNTLDIIIMLIDMRRYRDAQRVTKKLANYYKLSLSGSEEIITIREEIDMIEDYLELQRMRYGEKFTYEFEISQDVLSGTIPKMTLQPLVENAIYHGLKYKQDWGNIWIRCRKEKELIVLEIQDNGIGMKPDRLEEVRQLTEKSKKHFGVYSVGHRLKLYYGDSYGIAFDSIYDKGTLVTIHIPCKESKKRYD